MLISDLMNRSVETIEPGATLQAAAGRMRSYGIGALPVIDGGQLVGMITDRDITVRATALGKDPTVTPVQEAMTSSVVTCREDAPVAEAERLMEEKAVRRLVVLDSWRRVVGIISLDDIAILPGESRRAGEILEHLNEV
ncbi:CBS domain-containing protein [Hyalangium gracile]|uniref:CBS domain-containing protein n=1 Tax=Hyalangium gracile TaxID=394092 RepID=UPI001CCE1635|nr:CBS domain-containing protein [Hyalangium gracile]